MHFRLSALDGGVANGRDAPSLLRADCFRASGALDGPQTHQAAMGSAATLLDGLGDIGRTDPDPHTRKKIGLKLHRENCALMLPKAQLCPHRSEEHTSELQ